MRGWRKGKRQDSKRQQPSLPGLFASSGSSKPSSPTSKRLSTPHEQALDVAHSRLGLASLLFVIAYFVIAGRLAVLTLMSEAPEIPMSHQETSDGVASRADITDRNGTVLATSLPTISLCADAKKILNPDEAQKQLLSTLPDLDAKKLQEDLHGTKRCVMVKRHLTPKQYYEVNKLGIAGLEFRPDERRIYPTGNVMAHAIGYTDIDNNGLAGMEKQLDNRLEETPEPIALSLDLRVQTIMHRELKQAMTNFNAEAASGIVMDITNGEILAMVSLPDFDPQRPGEATDDQRFNRDTLGVYEMGSTFKIFNTALALDSGLIRVGDSFDTTHPIEIGHQTIKDFHPEPRWLNVAEIFTHSSNIGSARMAMRFGGARQRAFFSRLGLTEKTPVELPEVGSPLLQSAKDWNEATTMTAAFGHGIAVNAVQLLSAVGAVVNDGIFIRPTLLKRQFAVQTSDKDRIISPKTSAAMRALMRLVVTHGTAKSAEVPGYLIGGKTGTADKLDAHHRYNGNARLSSFIGVFPLNAPKYIVFALLDDPKGNAKTYGFATGGWTAAPVVSKVASQIGPLLDLPPMTEDMQAAAQHQLMKVLGSQILDGMPVDEGSNYASVESDSVQ